ncbi:hypothetical protein Pelo_16553 [Pelomyxa schiedti]|nr:hypothetical protein Pelo_16553 [Pelomyxa schiedti]
MRARGRRLDRGPAGQPRGIQECDVPFSEHQHSTVRRGVCGRQLRHHSIPLRVEAFRGGHIEVAEWITRNVDDVIIKSLIVKHFYPAELAGHSGKLAVVKWYFGMFPGRKHLVMVSFRKTSSYECIEGCKWLVAQFPSLKLNCFSGCRHKKTLRWLLESGVVIFGVPYVGTPSF